MAESRKTVTIVFADVTGSTALGEQTDPETMRRIKAEHRTAANTTPTTLEQFAPTFAAVFQKN